MEFEVATIAKVVSWRLRRSSLFIQSSISLALKDSMNGAPAQLNSLSDLLNG